jgi:hypothetical protein
MTQELALEQLEREHPLSEDLVQVINGILSIKNALIRHPDTGRTFLDYTIDELLKYQMNINILRVTLGEFAAKHQLQADFSYSFRKWSHASAWTPTKEKLQQMSSRVISNPDVEARVVADMKQESDKEILYKGYANRLAILLDTSGALERSISKRINILQSQMQDSRAVKGV